MTQTERERPRELSTWASLRLMLGPVRGPVVALVVASLLSGLTESVILTIVAQAAAALVDGRTHVGISIGSIRLATTVGRWLDLALVLAFVRLAFQGPLSRLPAQIGANMQTLLRREVFGAFTRASWSAQSRDREGQLQELLTNQVSHASMGSVQAAVFVGAAVIIPVLAAVAFLLNVIGAVAVLGCAFLLFAALRPLTALGGRRARSLSSAEISYAGGVSEATRLAEETQVFDAGDAQIERVDGLMAGARELYYRTQAVTRLVPYLYQSFVYIIVVGGLVALSAAGAGHVASLGAVVLLLVRAGTYGQALQGSLQFVRQGVPYVERLQAAAAGYRASRPADGDKPLQDIERLEFEGVSFDYVAGRPVLSELSFAVARGETIGIIGPSGAGKSTIVQILLQLRPPSDGRYLVNGVAAADYARADWHRLVAYVPQVPQLLHATVAENIRYFRSLDDSAVERAAKLARIDEDVVGWAAGYETIIGPRADAISGGQRQRICIARALAARPRVIVLDEPTSALDPASERLLQESLRELKAEATLFVVAHRPATLELCDRVMIVVGGRLEAFDTPAALRAGNAYYKEAAALSLGV